MTVSPEEIALAELAEHQRATGMRFEHPGAVVLPDPATNWRDEEVR